MSRKMTRAQSLELMGHLDKGTNLFGLLAPEIRARLYAVVEDPNESTWSNAYSILISGESMTTLWQACIKHAGYDVNSKPADGPWPKVPSRMQLLTALKAVLGPKTQMVFLNVAIEVDVEAWNLAYGTGTSVKEIRDDVRKYFVHTIREGQAGDGAILDVTERP